MAAIVRSRVEVEERMSAAEFLRRAPETKAELVDGVMVMGSPASMIHERLFRFLFSLLSLYAENHKLGGVLGSRTAVELAPSQVYEPDILFVRRERAEMVQNMAVMGAPDLVIEILSASTAAHDRGPKLRGYERAGVTELWLVDPYGPAGTEFYRLQEGQYAPTRLTPDNRLVSSAVLGFWMDVTWLWPDGEFLLVREALDKIERNEPS